MKVGSRPLILAAAGLTVVWLIGVALAASGTKISTGSSIPSSSHSDKKTERGLAVPISAAHAFALPAGQASAGPNQKSEEVYKNVQVLKGIPVDEFMGTMGIMSAALSWCCAECHTGAGTDTVKWELDTPRKRTARRMVEMVTAINRDNFQGRQVVSCWTCHRGRDRPVVTPALDTVYGEPILEMDDVLLKAPFSAAPDTIIDKYLNAIGGAQRWNSITSYTVTASSVGFGGFGGGGAVEIYAKAPDQRTTRIHFDDIDRGDVYRTFDGRAGWIQTPLTVVREYALAGGELDGAKIDAQLGFPGQIKQVLTNLRVSVPQSINGRDQEVIQGNGPKGLVVTLYFDKETGLLTRTVRYSNSPIGRVPTQSTYSNYRDVGNGLKMPFNWTFAWLDGRDAFEIKEVKLNVPIDAARFGRPPAPVKK